MPNEGCEEAEELKSRRRLAFATLLGRDDSGPGDGEGLKDCFLFPLDNEAGGTGPNWISSGCENTSTSPYRNGSFTTARVVGFVVEG